MHVLAFWLWNIGVCYNVEEMGEGVCVVISFISVSLEITADFSTQTVALQG